MWSYPADGRREPGLTAAWDIVHLDDATADENGDVAQIFAGAVADRSGEVVSVQRHAVDNQPRIQIGRGAGEHRRPATAWIDVEDELRRPDRGANGERRTNRPVRCAEAAGQHRPSGGQLQLLTAIVSKQDRLGHRGSRRGHLGDGGVPVSAPAREKQPEDKDRSRAHNCEPRNDDPRQGGPLHAVQDHEGDGPGDEQVGKEKKREQADSWNPEPGVIEQLRMVFLEEPHDGLAVGGDRDPGRQVRLPLVAEVPDDPGIGEHDPLVAEPIGGELCVDRAGPIGHEQLMACCHPLLQPPELVGCQGPESGRRSNDTVERHQHVQVGEVDQRCTTHLRYQLRLVDQRVQPQDANGVHRRGSFEVPNLSVRHDVAIHDQLSLQLNPAAPRRDQDDLFDFAVGRQCVGNLPRGVRVLIFERQRCLDRPRR